MTGILHYRALDERGEQILDQLEAESELSPKRMGAGERAYYIVAVGEVDLDPALAKIDPAWEEHVARLTARSRKQKTDKGLEIPVPTKGDFDAAMRKVAPPVGRKRPDEKDRPQKQSE